MKPIVWGRELSIDRATQTVAEMFGCEPELAKIHIEDALNGTFTKKPPLGVYPEAQAFELVAEFKRVFEGQMTMLTVREPPPPKMNEVFLIQEVSSHAWKNLGVSPELQKEIENEGGNKHAYEDAIAFLPILASERAAGNKGSPVEIYQLAMEHDEDYVPLVYKNISGSEKFRAALRKRSHEIKSAGRAGIDMILKMVEEFPAPVPQGYNEDEVFLELGSEWQGWKWVEVSKENCEHEGDFMQHCGQAHQNMLSLRDQNGRPHVTADINPTIPWVGQLKGKQNGPVDEKYWEMCGELFKYLAKITGKKPEFEDGIYLQSKAGTDFLNYLNEFGFAKTNWNEDLMNPIDGGDVPEDERAFFDDQDGPFGRNF